MIDIKKAKEILKSDNLTCVLIKGNTIYKSRLSGIRPMIEFIESKTNLSGFVAADKIVGKAAAYLFALAGIKEIYADVLSKKAIPVLNKYNIQYSFGILCDEIINREKNGMCPMESAVLNAESPQDAFIKIKQKLKELCK